MNTGIMVAPNGARLQQKEHEALPLVKDDIVNTALSCKNSGANAIHLHVRDDAFKHVLDVKRYKETIQAIRAQCKDDFVIQATTESVGMYQPKEMISLIKELKPQATSVAIKELLPSKDNKEELLNAKAFYQFARDENIGVQHILYSSDDLRRFHLLLEQEVITGDKHSILFVLGRYAKGQRCETTDLIPFLETIKTLKLENSVHWMLCAFGEMEIPALVAASILGGHCRIGFENSRVLPDGTIAKNNASQVQYLKQQLQALNIGQVETKHMKEVLGIFK
ncbi:MAG: 3-keto-5-aminohexanoate cleavage protein [Campylobacteraceae bacterium]|nr:3-keto-5-aminohexanoate cleavage protein [Campylobacteraceae bacterium]